MPSLLCSGVFIIPDSFFIPDKNGRQSARFACHRLA